MRANRSVGWVLVLALGLPAVVRGQAVEYLSDCPERLVQAQQEWGELGFDVAAHTANAVGQPLRIGDRAYAKGLGHHANGSLHVLLDGEFDRFEAEVGVQPCAGGSVEFRVLVDGVVRFASGVVRSGEAPRPVSVTLGGAQELMLEAQDTGDGISCDMANWAEARLRRAGAAPARAAPEAVDMAPFGRVVTWDPLRQTGTRAGRVEEYPAEDLFLETDLFADADGVYAVPVVTNRLACIGLQWLNRRAIRELRLGFAEAPAVPEPSRVRVEGWFGESAWQGEWKALLGQVVATDGGLTFHASAKPPVGAGLLLTRKVRWIWPAGTAAPRVRHPVAFTRSRWATTTLRIETAEGPSDAPIEIQIENGDWVNPPQTNARDGSGQLRPSLRLAPGTNAVVSLRHSLTSALGSDPTLLRLRQNQWGAAVAIKDVLDAGCVYLPEPGLIVARGDRPVTLAEYKQRIAGRRTILDEVRAMPDQTLEQAMARTHHAAQREGPVLLSLAGDNAKFIVDRDGTVRFSAEPAVRMDWAETAGLVRPEFGTGPTVGFSRRLEGGWLPIPVLTVEQTNLVWRQRTFVAPLDDAAADPQNPFAPRPSVCLIEYAVTNTSAAPTEARLRLTVLADARRQEPIVPTRSAGGYALLRDKTALGQALSDAAAPLGVSAQAGRLDIRGTLPAGMAAGFALVLFAEPGAPLGPVDAQVLRTRTERYWTQQLAPATQIQTPDRFLDDLIRSSQVRCLIAARNEAAGERIAPWIAAISYGPLESEAHSVVRGMDFLGHREFARRGLDYFIRRYNPNGFLTTGYTTFGTAWHLWSVGEHFDLHRDRAWFDRAAPEIKRVARWIERQADKTKRRRSDGRAVDEYGLMPPGVMADWNAYAFHLCLNAYYAAGLEWVGRALTEIGDPDGAGLGRRGTELAAATYEAFCAVQARAPVVPLRNGTWVRYYPSQVHSPGRLGGFFPGDDAGRSWCYDVELGAHQLVPTGVLDVRAHADTVRPMLDHMEDVQFLESGWFDYPAEANRGDWFNLGGFSKVQPYYTRNAEIYALADAVKPFIRSYFNTLAAMVNPEVLTFWEHFNHSGAWDKTHETGYFLHQTRTLLVTERGDDLWLAPFLPAAWLRDGSVVQLRAAPTRFGPVSCRIESHLASGRIDAAIEPPVRQPPRGIVLRLRHPDGKPIRAVRVDGRAHQGFAPEAQTVTLDPGPGPQRVEVDF
jgi:hypothetical protein